MATDWRSPQELDPRLDLALVSPPSDPACLETFNVWLADGAQQIGLSVYLFQTRWGQTRERALLFLPDGRTLSILSEGSFDRPDQPGGSSLRYHCVEPYRKWRYVWDAPAFVTSEAEELRGLVLDSNCPTVPVRVEIEAETVAEPWTIPLSTGPTSLVGPGQFADGEMLGKYEQLQQGRGTIRVGGESWNFSGVGLRAHVRGPRDTTGMGSHSWVCGYFPASDRGFCLKQLFTTTGEPYFSEAYIAQGGRIERAEILRAPPYARDPSDRALLSELAVGGRTIRITGETFHSTWIPLGNWGNGANKSNGAGAFASGHGVVPDAPLTMSQSTARFAWDGEEGFGMAEMSG